MTAKQYPRFEFRPESGEWVYRLKADGPIVGRIERRRDVPQDEGWTPTYYRAYADGTWLNVDSLRKAKDWIRGINDQLLTFGKRWR